MVKISPLQASPNEARPGCPGRPGSRFMLINRPLTPGYTVTAPPTPTNQHPPEPIYPAAMVRADQLPGQPCKYTSPQNNILFIPLFFRVVVGTSSGRNKLYSVLAIYTTPKSSLASSQGNPVASVAYAAKVNVESLSTHVLNSIANPLAVISVI